MTPADLDAQLRAALAPTAADRADADRIVDRVLDGSATASTGPGAPHATAERRRWAVPLLAACAAACLVIAVGVLARPRGEPDQVAVPGPSASAVRTTGEASVPDVAVVTCSAHGALTVQTPRVRAQSDGVHVRVTTQAQDTVVDLLGVGRTPTPGTRDVVVALSPGATALSCRVPGRAQGDPAELEVLDPTGSWLGGSTNLLCFGGMDQPLWASGPAYGATRRSAVQALVAQLPRPDDVTAIVRAPIGYAQSPTQVWTVDSVSSAAGDGPSAISVDVRHLPDQRYEARPEAICHRGTDAPAAGVGRAPGEGGAPERTPDLIDVTCTDGRLTASSPGVRAQTDGVVIRTTTQEPWTLRWGSAGRSGEHRFGSGGSALTAPLPVGAVSLRCGEAAAPAVTLTVYDPDGLSLDLPPATFCPAMAALDTDATGRGATPRDAVVDLAGRLSAPERGEVGRASVGYVGAGAGSAWTIRGADGRATLVSTTPADDVGDGYVARPDATCGRARS